MSPEQLKLQEIDSACNQSVEKGHIDQFEHNIKAPDDLSNVQVLHILCQKNGRQYVVDIKASDLEVWLKREMLQAMIEAIIFSTVNPEFFIRLESSTTAGHFFESDVELIGHITYDLLDTRNIDPMMRLPETAGLQYAFYINGMKDYIPIHLVLPWSKVAQLRRDNPNLKMAIKKHIEDEINQQVGKSGI